MHSVLSVICSLLLWIMCFCVSCVFHAFTTVHSCLVFTGWERADLLALVGGVYYIFVTFPCGILGQVWYLIVSFLDLCLLSYLSYDHLLEKAWPLDSLVCDVFLCVCFLSLSHTVSQARCGTWLYWFLIFAIFLSYLSGYWNIWHWLNMFGLISLEQKPPSWCHPWLQQGLWHFPH